MSDSTNDNTKGSKIGLGKGCLIAVGAIMLLAVVGAIVGGDGDGSGSKPSTSAASDAPALKVTAVELARAYEANEASAQLKYGEQRLEVAGTISDITLDFGNNPVLVLRGVNEFQGVQAPISDKQAAASLSKGQKITVLCAGVGEIIGTPMLEDCQVAPGEAAK